ncbi:MAG: VWA domain-containing protein [Spirochaetes bacterium]|nr:VWA domain-containing protein [Spirochaetota bacterium]
MSSEIAVLPYRIKNPSDTLTLAAGADYARMIGIAAMLTKSGIKITQPVDIESGMKIFGISPQETITARQLRIFGKERNIDYILVGSLSRAKGRYATESVLYSVKNDRVISRNKSRSSDIFKLAAKETEEAFTTFDNLSRDALQPTPLDTAFLIDISYRINSDWPAVKEAILEYAAEKIDRKGMDANILIIPFSDSSQTDRTTISSNSLINLKKNLENLKPAGGADRNSFSRSLNHAIQNSRWRHDSDKKLIIISNTPISKAPDIEKNAALARRKGIRISSICLGRLTGESRESYLKISEMGSGKCLNAAYHQRLFDTDGKALDVYLENGRLFKSRYHSPDWTKGLFEKSSAGGTGRHAEFLDEVFVTGSIEPSNMAEHIDRSSMTRILNKKEIESNFASLMKKLGPPGKKNKASKSEPVAKALLTDGRISVWCFIKDMDFSKFLMEKSKSRFVFTMGVSLTRDPDRTYGISINPAVREIPSDYIPANMKSNLDDMIKRPDYYISNGLTRPPVWFIEVKVEEFENLRKMKDIRE